MTEVVHILSKDTDSTVRIPLVVEAHNRRIVAGHLRELDVAALAELLADQLPRHRRWQL